MTTPSLIRPSFLSLMLLFICGCLALWVKNETSNERLIVLENRFRMFPLEVIVKTDGSPENRKICNDALSQKENLRDIL